MFTPYKEELIEWCKGLPEDNKQTSDVIVSWCESHPPILEALKEDTDLFNDSQHLLGYGKNEPPPLNPENYYKEILENNIRMLPSPPDKNNPEKKK